jgi:EF-hand domain pair
VHAVTANLNCSLLCGLLVLAKCFGIEAIVRQLRYKKCEGYYVIVMSNNLSSSDLELLFLEKLQLKYKLNERDLKKAFSRFDKDCNGSLDIKEISTAVRLMLNGVTDEQVRNLVKRFDFNGDGKITYEEFLSYLLSRSNTANKSGSSSTRTARLDGSSTQIRKPDEVVNYRRGGGISNAWDDRRIEQFRDKESQRQHSDVRRSGSSKIHQSDNDREIRYYNDQDSVGDAEDDNENEDYDEFPVSSKEESSERFTRKVHKQEMDRQRPGSASSEAPSDIGSSFDPTNAAELEHRCKTFLENLRSYLNKRVVAMRGKGDLPHHLTMSSRELLEKTGCTLLSKSFQMYTGADSGRGRARKEDQLVELGDFMR